MRSMTGFGRGESADAAIAIEISSVNRKQLELRFTLPRDLSGLETELRSRLVSRISRGAVSVRLNLNHTTETRGVHLDTELLGRLVTEAREAARLLDLSHDLKITDFLMIPGVIAAEELPCDDPALLEAVGEALERALEQFQAMRHAEGQNLQQDLTTRLYCLEELLTRIKPLTADLPEFNRKRLLEKLAQAQLPVDANDERLLKEVVFYADRGDTSEEITRLESHFAQFRRFLGESGEPVGRSMDFLLQEMFREITTLGNKAPVPEVSPCIVAFKTELEKLREQVQNIE